MTSTGFVPAHQRFIFDRRSLVEKRPRGLSPVETIDWFVSPEPMSGCWLWCGGIDRQGYGRMSGKRRGRSTGTFAHRLSWMAHRGAITSEQQVLHRCDVPACVNPDHLFLGTPQSNIADKIAKGRGACGERSGPSRLTAEKVLTIRAAVGSSSSLAAQFGVCPRTIRDIRGRRTWRHI